MRHKVKKIKIKFGKDANKMLVKKLIKNFLIHNKITTTIKKGKILKSQLERLVEKSKVKNEVNKNYLLRFISDKKLVKFLFEIVGPAIKEVRGGYIRLVKINSRDSDGSQMVKLEWAYPIVKK